MHACKFVNVTPWQPNIKRKESFSPEYELKTAKYGSGMLFWLLVILVTNETANSTVSIVINWDQ